MGSRRASRPQAATSRPARRSTMKTQATPLPIRSPPTPSTSSSAPPRARSIRTSGGSMDASNLLKPALASGDLRCIGSTTFSEYKSSFERDRALARRFQKIEVLEPSVEETVAILHGLKPHYEEHHGVRYTDEAL